MESVRVTMRAAPFEGKGAIELREVGRPEAGPGEAMTTICANQRDGVLKLAIVP